MTELSKSPEKISKMFDEISGKYDTLNHLFTLNMDKRWRRKIVQKILKDGFKKDRILDVASGTGDQTIELLKLHPVEIVSCDISEGMLDVQRQKLKDKRVRIIKKDLMDFDESEKFDIITTSFGFRNFNDQKAAMEKFFRLLNPGGTAIILEIFSSGSLLSKIFNLYFEKIVPKLGNMISGSDYAYNYLFNSVTDYYIVSDFIKLGENCGLRSHYTINNFLKIVNTIYLRKNEHK